MSESKSPSIAIIGPGNLGVGLAYIIGKNGHKLTIAGRDLETTKSLIDKYSLSANVATTNTAISNADICLLALNDASIRKFCELNAYKFKDRSIVAHFSGSLGSDILESAKTASKALICSIHPLNTFPSPEAAIQTLSQQQHNSFLYGEGDKLALETCNQLFGSLGFTPRRIKLEEKQSYHTACVFASNYLVSLIEASLSMAEMGGINREDFFRSISPLIQSTLDNIEQNGTATALSGPLARGDKKTVTAHMASLKEMDQNTYQAYLAMGNIALDLVRSRGNLPQKTIDDLQAALLPSK